MNWITGIATFLIFTLPQTMICTWFGFRFFGVEVRNFPARLAVFSFVTSGIVVVSLAHMPSYVHLPISIGAYALFLSVVFRELNWKYKVLLTVLMLVNVIVGEGMTLLAVTAWADASTFQKEHSLMLSLISLPGLSVVALAAWLMQRFDYSPGRRMARFIQEARQTPILYFVLLIVTQVVVLMIFMVARFLTPDERVIQWLLYIAILTILIVSIAAIRLIVKTRDEAIRVTQNAYVGDLMQVSTTIRGQRHDFINHVQVMYSMLAMNKHEPLKRYMEEVVSEIQAVSRIADQIPSTALGAFMQAKTAAAVDKKIRFEFSLPELPDTLASVRSVDLVRIIGNLVDNAFDEVVKLPVEQRSVSVRIALEQPDIVIIVSNPGEPLSEEDQSRMLAPGYSTKQGEHSGLGLPIVLERTRHYGGTLRIDNDRSSGTVNFIVRLPVDAGARIQAR